MAAPKSSELNSLVDYTKLVMAAIEALGEKEGSNESAISNYIESNNPELPDNHSAVLSLTLDKLKVTGQLVFTNDCYLKPDSDAPPKRGRGRPRKNKAAEAPTPVVGSPRPRGRPPKTRDPLAPAASPKKVSSGRPRGRQPKKVEPAAAPVPAPAASGGVKRGRGRPPKVRPAAPAAATVGA